MTNSVYDHSLPSGTKKNLVGDGVQYGGRVASTLRVEVNPMTAIGPFTLGPQFDYGGRGVASWFNRVQLLGGGIIKHVYDANIGGGATNILIPNSQWLQLIVAGPVKIPPPDGSSDPPKIRLSVTASVSWLMRATGYGEGNDPVAEFGGCSNTSWASRGAGSMVLFEATIDTTCDALVFGGSAVSVPNGITAGPTGTYESLPDNSIGGIATYGGTATVTPRLCTSATKFGDTTAGLNEYISPGAYQVVSAAITLDNDQHIANFLQYGELAYWTESNVTKSDVFGPSAIILKQGQLTNGYTGDDGASSGGGGGGFDGFAGEGAYWIINAPSPRGVTNAYGYSVGYEGVMAERFNPADPRPNRGLGFPLVQLMFTPLEMVTQTGQSADSSGVCHPIPDPPFPLPPPDPWTGVANVPFAGSPAGHDYSFSGGTWTMSAAALSKCPQQYCVRLIDAGGAEFGVQIKKNNTTWYGANNGYTVTLANLYTSVDGQSRWVLTITRTVSSVTTTWRFFTRVDWAAPLIDSCDEFDNGLQGCPPFTQYAAASPWFPIDSSTSDGSTPAVLSLNLFCPQKLASADGSCACTCSGDKGGTAPTCAEQFTSSSDGIDDATGNWSTPVGAGIVNIPNPSLVNGPDGKSLVFNKWYILADHPGHCTATYWKKYGLAQLDGTCTPYTSSPPPPVTAGTRCSSKGDRDPNGPPTRFRCVRLWASNARRGSQASKACAKGTGVARWSEPYKVNGATNFCVDTDDPSVLAIWNKWGLLDYLYCTIYYLEDLGHECHSADTDGQYFCIAQGSPPADFVPPCPPVMAYLHCGPLMGDDGDGGGGGTDCGVCITISITGGYYDGTTIAAYRADDGGGPTNYFESDPGNSASHIAVYFSLDASRWWIDISDPATANCTQHYSNAGEATGTCPPLGGWEFEYEEGENCGGGASGNPGTISITPGCTSGSGGSGSSMMAARLMASPSAMSAATPAADPQLTPAPADLQQQRLTICRDCPNWRDHDRDGNAVEACQKLIDRGLLGQLMHDLGIPNAAAQCADPANRRWLPVL